MLPEPILIILLSFGLIALGWFCAWLYFLPRFAQIRRQEWKAADLYHSRKNNPGVRRI